MLNCSFRRSKGQGNSTLARYTLVKYDFKGIELTCRTSDSFNRPLASLYKARRTCLSDSFASSLAWAISSSWFSSSTHEFWRTANCLCKLATWKMSSMVGESSDDKNSEFPFSFMSTFLWLEEWIKWFSSCRSSLWNWLHRSFAGGGAFTFLP